MADFFDPHDELPYRRVMGRFPTGLTIVTTQTPERRYGLTCQAFISVSLKPPLIGLCLTADSGTLWAIERTQRFCVNVLSGDQVEMARIFALSGADKFRGVDTTESPNGSPMLAGSVSWIDCDLYNRFDAGDHIGLLGEVKGIAAGDDTQPLLYQRGGYGTFQP